MFETTSRLAEKVAMSVSRRQFLGSLGRWAGATALAMGGLLTTVGTARAGDLCCQGFKESPFGFKKACKYRTKSTCSDGSSPVDCKSFPYPWC